MTPPHPPLPPCFFGGAVPDESSGTKAGAVTVGAPQVGQHPRPHLKPLEVYLLLAAINKRENGGGRRASLLPVAN